MPLKEWSTCIQLLNLLPTKGQRLGSLETVSISLTAFTIWKNLAVIGTNMAVLYIVDRDAIQLVHKIKCGNRNDDVTQIEVCEARGQFCVVAGMNSGTVYIYKLDISSLDSIDVLQSYTFATVHSHPVRCLCYTGDKLNLISGADDGKLILYDLINTCQPEYEPEVLLQEDQPVIQLDESDNKLLVSTLKHSFILDLKQGHDIKSIGTKQRKTLGPFGAYYCDTPSPCIIATRPGLRLWKCDLEGKVKVTLMYKEIMEQARFIEMASSVVKTSTGYDPPQFGPVCLLQHTDSSHDTTSSNQHVVTWCKDTLFVIDVQSQDLIKTAYVSSELNPITMVKCYGDELFILRSAPSRQLIRLATHPYEPKITISPVSDLGGGSHGTQQGVEMKQMKSSIGNPSGPSDKLKAIEEKLNSGIQSVKEKFGAAAISSKDMEQVGSKFKSGFGSLMQKINPRVHKNEASSNEPSTTISQAQTGDTPLQPITTDSHSTQSTSHHGPSSQSDVSIRKELPNKTQEAIDEDEDDSELVIRLTPENKLTKSKNNFRPNPFNVSNPQQITGSSKNAMAPDGDSTAIPDLPISTKTMKLSSSPSHLADTKSTVKLHDATTTPAKMDKPNHPVAVPVKPGLVEGTLPPVISGGGKEKELHSSRGVLTEVSQTDTSHERNDDHIDEFQAMLSRLDELNCMKNSTKTSQYADFYTKVDEPASSDPRQAHSGVTPIPVRVIQSAATVPEPLPLHLRPHGFKTRDGFHSSSSDISVDEELSDSGSDPLASTNIDEEDIYRQKPDSYEPQISPSTSAPKQTSGDGDQPRSSLPDADITSKILTFENWMRQPINSAPHSTPISLSITNHFVWLCDARHNVYVSKRSPYSLAWRCLEKIKADQISVADSGSLAWKVFKGKAQAGHCRVAPFNPAKMKWTEAVPKAITVAVDETSAWYVGAKGDVWRQTGLSKERPIFRGSQIATSLSIVKISSRGGVTWALTKDGSIVCSNTSGAAWEDVNTSGSTVDLSLDPQSGAWILDMNDTLWYTGGVTLSQPKGDGTLWQVSYLEPIDHENRRFLRDLLKDGVFSYTSFALNRAGIAPGSGESLVAAGSHYVAVYTPRMGLNYINTHATGHIWASPDMSSISHSSVWRLIEWCGNESLFAVRQSGELMYINISKGVVCTVEHPVPRGTEITHISASSTNAWLLATPGLLYHSHTADRSIQLGLDWKRIKSVQFSDNALLSLSTGDENAWCIDVARNVYMSIGVNVNRHLMEPAWVPVDTHSQFTSIHINNTASLVFALDKSGNVYTRKGITSTLPIGTSWECIVGLQASVLTVSENLLWAVALGSSGSVFCRCGISERRPAGEFWHRIPGQLKEISASPNDKLMGLSPTGILLQHKMRPIGEVTERRPGGQTEEDGWQLV